jgi:riboflavin biosynthesis pyrimidine reductase
MKPLEKLYGREPAGPDHFPEALSALYDGALVLRRRSLFANFVSSLDGVIAIPSVPNSPSTISGKSEADRFVMGLLRASADVVLIGAGTVRAEPDHRWTPEFVYPQGAGEFARLRAALGLAPHPRLAVVTSGGELGSAVDALEDAFVFTTRRGARRLERLGKAPAMTVEAGPGDVVDPAKAVELLRSRGHLSVLCEGGPTLIGQLVRRRLVDELFLTLSPVLIGRDREERRLALIEGVDLLGNGSVAARLASVRGHGSHLFLRYSLESGNHRVDEISP